MQLPETVQTIVDSLYARFHDLAHGTDDQRRELTRKICEQSRFTMGTEYGWKKSAEGHPPSKDVLAKRGGAELIGWDLFNGDTRVPNHLPESISLAGQIFIEVSPIDHLNAGNPPGDDPPETGELERRIVVLETDVRGMRDEITGLLGAQIRIVRRLEELEVAGPGAPGDAGDLAHIKAQVDWIVELLKRVLVRFPV